MKGALARLGELTETLRRRIAPDLRPRDAQLNVYNLQQMRAQPPLRFDYVRFDSNNDCNVHCVYCHNHRSKDLVDTEAFRTFLDENVLTIANFQVGCIMEPTLDARMCDLMLLVAGSRARPTDSFLLQTNGILLHRHDHAKLHDAGLTHVSVSIDSADPATHKLLRGGTSMAKVSANLAAFGKSCPGAEIQFITTVTRVNVAEMEALVAFGLDLGARRFVLREMFYMPENDVVDHARMPALLLQPGEFASMRERVLARFGDRATFEFADNPTLDERGRRMKADSFR